MDCEACSHPLAFHDPCSKCDCQMYQPADRKERVAMLTDHAPRVESLKEVRAREARHRGVTL